MIDGVGLPLTFGPNRQGQTRTEFEQEAGLFPILVFDLKRSVLLETKFDEIRIMIFEVYIPWYRTSSECSHTGAGLPSSVAVVL